MPTLYLMKMKMKDLDGKGLNSYLFIETVTNDVNES